MVGLTPAVVGDLCGPFTKPDNPPTIFPLTVGGGVKVVIRGRPPALYPGAVTAGGPVAAALPVSAKVIIEGRPVILVGSLMSLATGWVNGPVIGPGAFGVTVA